MQGRIIISATLIVAFLGLGGGVAYRLISTPPAPPTREDKRPALLVRSVTLEPQTIVEPIIGYGAARADRHARVAAQVSGEIVELNPDFRVGTPVTEGELLVRIDDREYQRQLDRTLSLLAADEAQLKQLDVEEQNTDRLIEIADSELQIAQREYERVLGLFEAKQAPRRELDLARQDHERARRALMTLENRRRLVPQERAAQEASRDLHAADLELTRIAVERCSVRAPFRGRLETADVEIGERVSIGMRLFALLDPDLIEVPIELPVSVRDRVSVDADCRLSLESNSDTEWRGRVARVSPQAKEATRTFSLYVEIDNTEHEQPLMPGVFVRAMISGPTWSDALVIPRGAIEQDHVFIGVDGMARLRDVTVKRRIFDQAIVDGLSPGDAIIVSNLDALYDGAAIRMADADDDSMDGLVTTPEEPAPVGAAQKKTTPAGS